MKFLVWTLALVGSSKGLTPSGRSFLEVDSYNLINKSALRP